MKIKFGEIKRSGGDVIFAENLSKSFGTDKIFADVSLDIKRGERVCMIGANGVGKTTLLKILAGAADSVSGAVGSEAAAADSLPDTGEVEIGIGVKIGYYDQHQESLDGTKTILEELQNDHPLLSATDLRKLLGRFLFRGDKVFQEICTLSGGEKARLSLLKLILSGANTLFLDEPTNHLDIASMDVIESALADFGGTLFIISHDRYLLETLPSRIVELTPRGLVGYPGNFDYYLEKKADFDLHEKLRDDRDPISSAAEERKRAKEQETIRRRRERGIAETEAAIETLESEIAVLETRQRDERSATDFELLAKIHSELEQKQTELSALLEKWETLLAE